jgi:hypothetical protein
MAAPLGFEMLGASSPANPACGFNFLYARKRLNANKKGAVISTPVC